MEKHISPAIQTVSKWFWLLIVNFAETLFCKLEIIAI